MKKKHSSTLLCISFSVKILLSLSLSLFLILYVESKIICCVCSMSSHTLSYLILPFFFIFFSVSKNNFFETEISRNCCCCCWLLIGWLVGWRMPITQLFTHVFDCFIFATFCQQSFYCLSLPCPVFVHCFYRCVRCVTCSRCCCCCLFRIVLLIIIFFLFSLS